MYANYANKKNTIMTQNQIIIKKSDIINALIIGEAAAWLMWLIGKNLISENSIIVSLDAYLNYLPIVFPLLCVAGLYGAFLISRFIPIIHQIGKFVLVGGLNFLIDMGVLNFLVFYTGISAGLEQSFFKGIAFLVAVINSYFWNKFWTFKRKTKEKVGKEFFQFIVVSFIGLFINLGIDYILVNQITPLADLPLRTWAQFSAMLAAIAALFWNFIGYKFIVFDKK
ncbi:MAG TPA: GtrA family protein [Candidatus Wolfebacteria bacterium]|nr:GtrA family protein [Candidatus Wolfebacteria bacterium]